MPDLICYNMYNLNKANFSKLPELTVSDSELDIICPELARIATDFNPI